MSSSPVSLPKDTVSTTEDLAKFATDLTDYKIQQVGRIVGEVNRRYGLLPNTAQNLEAHRDELLTKLADINVLATVDPSPCFYGEPPILEIIGEMNVTNDGAFDHERKAKEVKDANARGEAYRGQKERHKG